MGTVCLDGERGRDVEGEWESKPQKLYLSIQDGQWVSFKRSDSCAAPTLFEISLAELLQALGEAV